MRSALLLEDEIESLFRDIDVPGSFDKIVPVERKGTAVLRALIESGAADFGWDRIVSDAALDLLPDHYFAGSRVLLFNEMIHHGHNTRKVRQRVLKRGASEDNIKVAAFAVHEGCSADSRPDYCLHGWLAEPQYEQKRAELVSMLQRHGSLLLDTEHVETTVTLHCSVREFFESVAGCGSAIEFRSAGKHNLTVYDLPELGEDVATRFCPKGGYLEGAVKKGRVVQRSPNEFALIGIWYPAAPVSSDQSWVAQLPDALAFLRDMGSKAEGYGAFFVAGLLCGLQVLRAMLAPVYALGSKVTVSAPTVGDRRIGSSLGHLLALYPSLPLEELGHYINALLTEIPRGGIRRGRIESYPEDDPEDEVYDPANRLARELLIATQQRRDLCSAIGRQLGPSGLSNAELFEVATARCGLSRGVASAALDKLIDDAVIVTRVEKDSTPSGYEVHMRTFEPDGEIVASHLRRVISVYGGGCPKCRTA